MANSKRKCRHCGEYKSADDMIKVPLGYFCDYEHASLHAISKSKAFKEKNNRKKIAEKKKGLLTARDWTKKAQAAVNAYVRLRDKEKPCISCSGTVEEIESKQGWKVGGCWDAGHFRSRGAAGHLRFNTLNIHKQCKACNGGSGKFSSKSESVGAAYRANLVEKIGMERVERLENDNEPKKFTIGYLQRLQKIFLKRARHLKKIRGI